MSAARPASATPTPTPAFAPLLSAFLVGEAWGIGVGVPVFVVREDVGFVILLVMLLVVGVPVFEAIEEVGLDVLLSCVVDAGVEAGDTLDVSSLKMNPLTCTPIMLKPEDSITAVVSTHPLAAVLAMTV
jgi:hypothetical protein